MKTSALKAFMLFLFAQFFITGLVSAGAADTALTAKATVVKGRVTVTPLDAKMTVAVKVGRAFSAGDKISTGDGAHIEIQYEDGSVTALAANTDVFIRTMKNMDNGSTQISLGLFAGRIRSLVAKMSGKDSRFEYVTKTSVCGVAGSDVSAESSAAGDKFQMGAKGVGVLYPNADTLDLKQVKLMGPNEQIGSVSGAGPVSGGFGGGVPVSGGGGLLGGLLINTVVGNQPYSFMGNPLLKIVTAWETQPMQTQQQEKQTKSKDLPDVLVLAASLAGTKGKDNVLTEIAKGRPESAAYLAGVALAGGGSATVIASAMAKGAPSAAAAVVSALIKGNPGFAADIALAAANAVKAPANATPEQTAAAEAAILQIAFSAAVANPAAAAAIMAALIKANPGLEAKLNNPSPAQKSKAASDNAEADKTKANAQDDVNKAIKNVAPKTDSVQKALEEVLKSGPKPTPPATDGKKSNVTTPDNLTAKPGSLINNTGAATDLTGVDTAIIQELIVEKKVSPQ